MKKFKTIACAAIAAAMALTFTACDETAPINSGDPTGSNAPGTTAPQTTPPRTTFDTDQNVIDSVKDLEVENPDLEITDRIKWMAWWEIDETTPAAELFKKTYGTPANGTQADRNGMIFDYTYVAYDGRFDSLGTAIAADDGPDIFPFEISDFPYGVLRGRYQPVDDIVNLNSPKWDATRDLMDDFVLNGKHYCAFYEISMNNLFYYRTSIVNDLGVEDPRTMFEEGRWDWDAFLDMARKFQQSGEGKYVIDGYGPEQDFLLSTGTPMVGNENGVIVNNLRDPSVERAENLMLRVLQEENLRYPRHELNGWNVNPKLFADGDILFYADGGTWVWESTISKYAQKNGWDENEIQVVPCPKDPQADAHYVTLKQDSLMWCKGSKNPNGVSAWIDCCVTASQDPTVKEAAIDQAVDKYGWNKEVLQFIYSLCALDGSSPVTPIVDFKNGLGAVSDTSAAEAPIQSLTSMVYLTGETFTSLRETHEPAIQAAIYNINKAIQNS